MGHVHQDKTPAAGAFSEDVIAAAYGFASFASISTTTRNFWPA
jgi:hypothetical protein